MSPDNYYEFAYIFIGLLLGGVVKGTTGVGTPLIAIPVIAALYDVRVAVVLMVIPNFWTNIWQIFKYKENNIHPSFNRNLAVSGFIGAGIGTALLAFLPLSLLSLLISLVVFFYIALRLIRPDFVLPFETANRIVSICGTSGGLLQGALGLSAPIVITFLHAAKFPRATFILTASTFFATMSVIQLPMQVWLGLMTWKLSLLGTLAIIPIMIGLQIGEYIGKRSNPESFDKMILILLAALGFKMLFDAI